MLCLGTMSCIYSTEDKMWETMGDVAEVRCSPVESRMQCPASSRYLYEFSAVFLLAVSPRVTDLYPSSSSWTRFISKFLCQKFAARRVPSFPWLCFHLLTHVVVILLGLKDLVFFQLCNVFCTKSQASSCTK